MKSSPSGTERSWLEIDLDAFKHNLEALKACLKPHQNFMQIVKADAYGHGALEISKVALECGAVMLGVANLEEGRFLRLQGIAAPILILSPPLHTEIPAILQYSLMPSISDLSLAEAFDAEARKQGLNLAVHLKIDSGMHRSGVALESAHKVLGFIRESSQLRLDGIYSHFASSENDPSFSDHQEKAFSHFLEDAVIDCPYLHFANSSAVVNGLGTNYNLVRLGILSYGVYTNPGMLGKIDLKPVMTFKSRLAQIKEISRGEGLGYNLTWHAPSDGSYGIIPVGYADGYDYLLGNKSHVSIENTLVPVIGKVSMDMICLDLTDTPDVSVGDEVILLGGSQDCLRAEHLAELYGGSAYELLCQLGRRARRHYYQDGLLINSSPLSRRDFVPDDFSDNKLSSIIEAAVLERMGGEEIGSLVFHEILANLFFEKDSQIHYRRGFHHSIELIDTGDPKFYAVSTELSYQKILDDNYFIVACAQSDAVLQNYFQRKDVEYRWLLDEQFDITKNQFEIHSIKVNGLDMLLDTQMVDGCLEVICRHHSLESLVGRELRFEISTRTIYPRKSHQMSVFITEMTKGVSITFKYPQSIKSVECIPVFSGQNRYPSINRTHQTISVSTGDQNWSFPLSGLVFAY